MANDFPVRFVPALLNSSVFLGSKEKHISFIQPIFSIFACMKYFFACALCVILYPAYAQHVKPLKLDELEARMANGGDTTYVVNFWATWCVPCVQELPHFERLQADYKDRPLKVLLVSLDFKSKLESQVIPFVQKKGLKNEVFWLDEPDQQVYIDRVSKDWSGAIPATLIVNKNAHIRSFFEREFSYPELHQTIDRLKIQHL